MALGPTTSHWSKSSRPSGATARALRPPQGNSILARRPQCRSWIPGTAPNDRMKSVMRRNGAMNLSSQIPRSATDPQPRRLDCRPFLHDKRGAARRHSTQMHEVPVGRKEVSTGILPHRRRHHAVSERHAAKDEG